MNINEAALALLSGKLLVFPTETVYGLGALASNKEAVQKIYEVKQRPSENPLILHIAENNQLETLVREIPKHAQILIDTFWPGPLTICLKKSNRVSDLVTAGLPTVCVRRPKHKIAHDLLTAVGEAVAAPSANISGKPSATTYRDAWLQLNSQGVYFLNGGQTLLGLESTVVDCSSKQVRILRPGSIPISSIERVLDTSVLKNLSVESISSPGQLLSHYSPNGQLTVLFGNHDKRRKWLHSHKFSANSVFGMVGETENLPGKSVLLSSSEDDMPSYASRLYAFLNYCDRIKAEQIFLELPSHAHELLNTLLDRLEKASNGNILHLP